MKVHVGRFFGNPAAAILAVSFLGSTGLPGLRAADFTVPKVQTYGENPLTPIVNPNFAEPNDAVGAPSVSIDVNRQATANDLTSKVELAGSVENVMKEVGREDSSPDLALRAMYEGETNNSPKKPIAFANQGDPAALGTETYPAALSKNTGREVLGYVTRLRSSGHLDRTMDSDILRELKFQLLSGKAREGEFYRVIHPDEFREWVKLPSGLPRGRLYMFAGPKEIVSERYGYPNFLLVKIKGKAVPYIAGKKDGEVLIFEANKIEKIPAHFASESGERIVLETSGETIEELIKQVTASLRSKPRRR